MDLKFIIFGFINLCVHYMYPLKKLFQGSYDPNKGSNTGMTIKLCFPFGIMNWYMMILTQLINQVLCIYCIKAPCRWRGGAGRIICPRTIAQRYRKGPIISTHKTGKKTKLWLPSIDITNWNADQTKLATPRASNNQNNRPSCALAAARAVAVIDRQTRSLLLRGKKSGLPRRLQSA